MNTLSEALDLSAQTVTLKLVRDGVNYYFYVNGAMVLAGSDLTDEIGAAGFFSFGTELTLTDYSVAAEDAAYEEILAQAKADAEVFNQQRNQILQDSSSYTLEALALGAKLWNGRGFTFTELPEELIGQSYIYGKFNTQIDMTVLQNGYLYVLTPPTTHANFPDNILAEGSGFTKLNIAEDWCLANYSNPINTLVYERAVTPGEQITIDASWAIVVVSRDRLNLYPLLMPNDGTTVKTVAIGERIWNDETMDYTFISMPANLIGQEYLYGSISGGVDVTAGTDGYFYVITHPRTDSNFASGVDNYDFKRLELPQWTFADYSVKRNTWVYELKVTTGERIQLDPWWGVLIGSETQLDLSDNGVTVPGNELAVIQSDTYASAPVGLKQQVFSDQSAYYYHTIPYWMAGKSFLCAPLNGGSATVTKAGKLYLIGRNEANGQKYLDVGFTHVMDLDFEPWGGAGYGGGNFAAMGFALYEKDVTVGETVTWGRWGVPLFYSGKTLPVEPVAGVTDIEITQMPEKTTYQLGETFDATGLVVTGMDANGNKVALSQQDYLLAPTVLSADVPAVSVIVNDQICAIPVTVTDENGNDLTDYSPADVSGFTTQKAPIVTGSISLSTVDDIVATIQKEEADGATGFIVYLTTLAASERTVENLKRIADCTKYPVMALAYGNYDNLEARLNLWRMAVEAGFDAVDIPMDTYSVSYDACKASYKGTVFEIPAPKEVSMDADVIAQQQAFMAQLRQINPNVEILMSAHVGVAMNQAQGVALAKEMENRGADIAKIVLASTSDLEEALQTNMVLQQELNVPFFYNCAGAASRPYRTAAGLMGTQVVFCCAPYHQINSYVYDNARDLREFYNTIPELYQEIESVQDKPEGVSLSTNYFTETQDGVYTLTTNSAAQHMVDDVLYDGEILKVPYYSVQGTISLTNAADWGQARILVSSDAENEYFIALEKIGENFQIFTMSKAMESNWNDWRLIEHVEVNGSRNAIDFEVIVNGSHITLLIDDKICYESQRVSMTESTVKFTGYNTGKTTVENLAVQIFETGEAADSYLATKSQKDYVSRFQSRMDSLYAEYITENNCAGNGGTLIFGDSNMDFWSTWEAQTGLVKYDTGYNVGIGGSTTLDWLHAYDQLIKPFEADRFVILVGGNDVNVWGDDGEVVVQRLQTLFEKLHADHPYAEIYYIYTTPSPSAYSNGIYTPAKLGALVEGSKTLCESLAYVQGIDVFDLMVTDDKLNSNTELFSTDLVHMNEAGYAVFSAHLYEQIFQYDDAFFGQNGQFKTSEQFDLTADNGANTGTVTVSENGIALGYVDDFYAENFYFEAKLHVNGIADTESYPKFGMFLENEAQRRSFYVDMTTELTSGVVGAVTSVNGNYDWANSKSATVADMAFSGEGETVTLAILKQGKRVHLFVNGNYALSGVWDMTADAVVGIFSFNTGLTITEYFTSVSQDDLDAKAALIPEAERNKGDLFGYAAYDGVTYGTSAEVDLSADNGEAPSIRVYGGAPQYAYLNDVYTDRFCFETQINVESVLNNDGWPKFGLMVNGASEMVKFFVDMTPSLTATHVGVVYQPTGGGDDWAGSKSCEVPGMSFAGSDTVKLKLIRDGKAYFFYVNDVLVMYDDAGFKAEKGAVGIFSFNTVLTASNYKVSAGICADSAVADATAIGLTCNYFAGTENNGFTLTTDSDAQHLVDDLTRGGYALREDFYRVSGTLTLTDAQDWGQARILVSSDAQNEHFIALEKVPSGNYQIFSMSKASQEAWDVWQLISGEQENGTRNSLDFELVVINSNVYFLLDGVIVYASDRVSMTHSQVKFTGFNIGTTVVENLSAQVFETQEAAESYLVNKSSANNSAAKSYQNTLQTEGADPSVIYVSEGEEAGYYYMYVTSDALGAAGFLAYRSRDMVQWECVGTALSAFEQYDEATGYTTVSYLSADYWAPEVIYDADTDLYYLFYSATRQEDGVTRFYADIAVSPSPAGPFVAYHQYFGKEPVVLDEEAKTLAYAPVFDFANMDPDDPLYEAGTNGYMKVIDMSPFVDPVSGKKYMYFCHDHAAELGITKSGIYVIALNDDYTPDYSQVHALTEADSSLSEGKVNEAPFVVYNAESGKYYLLYSANAFYQQSYCVRVAVADSPVGPFTKLTQEEGGWLLYAENDLAAGTGHCSVVSRNGQDYIVYHAHKEQTDEALIRGIAVDELHWVENANGLLVPVANGPSVAAIPLTTDGFRNIAASATVTADHLAEGSAEAMTDGLILHHESSFLQDALFDGSSATVKLQFNEAAAINGIAIHNGYEHLFSSVASIRLQLVGGGYITFNDLAVESATVPGSGVCLSFTTLKVVAIEIVMPASDAQYAVSEIAVMANR